MGAGLERHRVEHEELRLRADHRLVRHAEAPHVPLSLFGDVAGVLGVVLAGDRVADGAGQGQRAVHEGVDHGGVRLGDDQQVGLVHGLPPAHAGPVEPEPLLEAGLREAGGGQREVLLAAGEVHEPQIDRVQVAFAAEGEDFAGRHRGGRRVGAAGGGAWGNRGERRECKRTGPEPPPPGRVPRRCAWGIGLDGGAGGGRRTVGARRGRFAPGGVGVAPTVRNSAGEIGFRRVVAVGPAQGDAAVVTTFPPGRVRPAVPAGPARLTAARPAIAAGGPARRPPRFDPPAGRPHFDPLTTPGRPTLPPESALPYCGRAGRGETGGMTPPPVGPKLRRART